MLPTKDEQETINTLFFMRSHGIALIRYAEKALKERKLIFEQSLKDEFLNRPKKEI